MPFPFAVSVTGTAIALVVSGLFAAALPSLSVAQARPFSMLEGDWRGSGVVSPRGQSRERVVCRLSYNLSGDSLNQTLDCAGADYRITATGKFTINGDRVSGTWRETQFGFGGGAVGSIRGDRIFVRISGDRFQGRMSIQVPNRSRHTVDITHFDPGSGQYTEMASINFRR